MRVNIIALALTIGLFWGAAILIVASANLIWPSYGRTFLDVIASVHLGYHTGVGPGSVVTGALYGSVDGAIGGAVFGWLYTGWRGGFRGAANPSMEATPISDPVLWTHRLGAPDAER